jgi:quinol---cytochrome-c reductase cytochrome c subunit
VGASRSVPWGMAVVLGAVALLVLTAPAPSTADTAQQPAPADVRLVYLRDCATCHGAEGEGTHLGPGIAGIGRAPVDYVLSTGRMPINEPDEKMERRPPKYPPAMRRALVDYVAAFGAGGVDMPVVDLAGADLALGGELYRLQCAACHAWAGDGGALLHREAPTLKQSTATQIAEAVRAGPGSMPAFGAAALDDHELASVVAYVRSLRHPEDRGGWPLWHLGPLPEGGVAWIIGMGLLVLASAWIGERNPT